MGQNGLATSRWTHQQQVVAASSSDGESLTGEILSRKAENLVGWCSRWIALPIGFLSGLSAALRRFISATAKTFHELSKRCGASDRQAHH